MMSDDKTTESARIQTVESARTEDLPDTPITPMSGDKVAVKPRDENLTNSPITTMSDDATVMANEVMTCTWNGVAFEDGATVSTEGITYECHYGNWVKAG